jgi:glutaredoxin 2
MKLSAQQIDQLYAFTRQHFVEWYDLQSELVDHLANAIEQEWKQNPNRTFEEILNKEFQKFGVFGFMGVVEERQKFLNRKYTRLIWSYYKEFFGLPKIILTIALVYGMHTINQLIVNQYIFPIIVALFLLIAVVFTSKKRNYFKKKARETGVKWLFEDIMINRIYLLIFTLPSAVINLCILF